MARDAVELRIVEELRLEAAVIDGGEHQVLVEWGGGSGPLALRPVCACKESGVCSHIVAVLETVRVHMDEPVLERASALEWVPARSSADRGTRARCVWIAFAVADAGVTASLFLDTPRLRGVSRDANAVVAMMDATPAEEWDDADRRLLRDEAVREAFSGRASGKLLARAMFALARHPRVRFDAGAGAHPSEGTRFEVDPRGVSLRAVRRGATFAPRLQSVDGRVVRFDRAAVLEGPPDWLVTDDGAYLLDGTFDVAKVLAAAEPEPLPGDPTIGDIIRVAPLLEDAERAALGVTDARSPAARAALAWSSGALVASVSFVDLDSKASTPFDAGGTIAIDGRSFVRFGADFAALVRDRFLSAGFVPRGGESFALHGPARAAAFVRDVLPTWNDISVRLDPNLRDLESGASRFDVAVAVRQAGEREPWFDLDLDVFVEGDGTALTPAEIEALLGTGERYVELRGRIVDLEGLRRRRDFLADLAGRRRTGLAAILALADELRDGVDRLSLPPEVEAIRARLREFSGITEVEPPELATGALRTYQRRGLDFLAYLAEFSFGGILADDMGLGKTLQMVAYLLWRRRRNGPAPSLVIAPTSVTHAWETEIARFAPELRTLRLQSGVNRAARYDEIENVDVVITSYALARLDVERLAEREFRTLVLDEAQHAKNPASQIAKVVRALRAEHRVALTGTPIENSLRDLWAIFSFVEPELFGSERTFRRRFEVPIADGDDAAAAALRSRLEPFVMRRTKEDVAPELPERTEVTLECELSPLQRRLYTGVAEAARRDLLPAVDAHGMERSRLHILSALTRLRQICAHPGLVFEEHRAQPEASGKFDTFLETIDEIVAGDHRVLVFSSFASMLRLMRAEFDGRGLAYCYLDGATKDRDRQSEVERFMSAAGPPLFLCSLKAGGVGLTLTAADYVVLYDPWWNPAVERQAIDRTHRIGQQRPVTAYRLVTAGTVEEKIRSLAERKHLLSKSVIKADGALSKALTREDLEMLFADPEVAS